MSSPQMAASGWPSDAAKAIPDEQDLDKILVKWQAAKLALAVAKETEMNLRKQAFNLGFGEDADEGTNKLELGNGYELKGVKKLNYKLVVPTGFDGAVVDAVDECAERFAKISNEGGFIADRLFKYSVDLSISEYRLLAEDAKVNEIKNKLLNELNKILEISEATPTLEIKEPKAKKG